MSLKSKALTVSLRDYFQNGYILVVDDVPNMRKTLRNILRSLEVKKIIEAGDGDSALAILRNKSHHKLDIIEDVSHKKCLFVLLDWCMPRMSGIDAAQEIRADKEAENTPILMITGESARDQVIQASAEVGVNGIMLKPFTAGALEKKMLSIIQLRANPPEHVKLITASEMLVAQGRHDESLELLQRAMKMTSHSSARVHVLKGESLKEQGKYEEARCAFAEAMTINPNYLKIYEQSADLAMKEDKKDEALSFLKEATKISPCNAERHAAIGKIHLEKGDKEEAQKAFEGALKHNPKIAKQVAEAYLKEGNAEQAEEFFRRSLPEHGKKLSLEEKREYVHIANRLGIALRKQGKIKEAIAEYQKACKHDPDDEVIYYNMGKAYIVLANKENASSYINEAKKYLKKAVDLDPGFEEARVELSKL